MSNLTGLQRALEIVNALYDDCNPPYGKTETDYGIIQGCIAIRDNLESEIEKEKANSSQWIGPSVMPMKIIEGKAFTSLYEANQELYPTNTIFGTLANKPPLDSKLTT